MTSRNEQVGAVLTGSVFLGVWVYGLLFSFDPDASGRTQDVGRWLGWGIAGIAIAAAGYGTRALEGGSRLAAIVGLGVLSTVVVLGALLNANWYSFATLCTATGAGLIAAALPAPGAVPVREPEPATWKEV